MSGSVAENFKKSLDQFLIIPEKIRKVTPTSKKIGNPLPPTIHTAEK
jgi:hypothetical protein